MLLFLKKKKICHIQARQCSRCIYCKVKIAWFNNSELLFIAVRVTVFLEQKVCTKLMNSKLACKKNYAII